MIEKWKPVLGFEKYYQISNFGRLKRIAIERYSFIEKKKITIKTDKIIKPTEDRGYMKVNLSVNGKRTLRYIHRLVAESYIPNPKKYKEVNHKDNCPSNNNVNNLEWCDRKYNLNYMIEHQKKIKENNELRLEILENLFYGIELGYINNINQVKNMIDENLLND